MGRICTILLIGAFAALSAPSEAAAAGPVRRGVSTARSSRSSLAACQAAKARANATHCRPALAAEKAVGACTCSVDNGGWSCRVQWVEICQRRHPAKSSRAVTSTHRGRSKWSEVDACYAAEVDARRFGCPTHTLDRRVSSCVWEEAAGSVSCRVDLTIWGHR